MDRITRLGDAFEPFAQRTAAREMRTQKLHLIRQDTPPLQVDVLGMRGRKWNGQQLHPGLLRAAIAFMTIAVLAGCNDIVPGVFAAPTDRPHMIPGKLGLTLAPAAIHAKKTIASEQRGIAQRGRVS